MGDDELLHRIRLASGAVIAVRIRQARKATGLSHDRFGERAGVGRHHLIKLEQAKHRPRPDMLRRIAAAAEREPDWFLDGTREAAMIVPQLIEDPKPVLRLMFALFAVILALTGCASASATPTRHGLDREIRACFVHRGAHIVMNEDGGTAQWGHTGIHWAGWSYVLQGRRITGVIGLYNNHLTPFQRRAAVFCTRWPR